MSLSVCLGPLHLPRVMFSLEVSVAFRSTKSECLSPPANNSSINHSTPFQLCCASHVYLGVITDEGHAVSRIDRTRTEVALFNSHSLSKSKSLIPHVRLIFLAIITLAGWINHPLRTHPSPACILPPANPTSDHIERSTSPFAFFS